MISDSSCIYNRDKIERIFKLMSKACDENIKKYNLKKMITYSCKGYDLIGSKANTHDPKRHFLVKNNHYDVYEIPLKSNKGLKMTGTFLVLFYNKDFDYWTFAQFNHRFYKSKYGTVKEDATYLCGGEFRITEVGSKMTAFCITGGNKCCRGFRSTIFDNDNVRKEEGYHTTFKVINRYFQ